MATKTNPENPTRVDVTPSGSIQALRPKGSKRVYVLIAVLVFGAGAWWVGARLALESALAAEIDNQLNRAADAWRLAESRAQERLSAQCEILSEDPRLKSTLATPEIDEATIEDILKDLKKLIADDLVLVLTPEGVVRASAEGKVPSGLNLGSSQVVRDALSSQTAVRGRWILDDVVMNVAAVALRFGERPFAIVLLATKIRQDDFDRVFLLSGARSALIASDQVVQSRLDAPEHQATVTRISTSGKVTLSGQVYRTLVLELEGTAARVVFLLPKTDGSFARMRALLVGPLVLALAVAGLFFVFSRRR